MTRLLLPVLLSACAPGADFAQDGSLLADAGPRKTGPAGESFVFDGTDSTGAELDLSWRLGMVPPGSALTDRDIVDARTAEPLIVPDVPGQYELILRACDVFGACDEESTWAWATDNAETRTNSAPLANAGADRSINLGTLTMLNGRNSVSNSGTPLTFWWRMRVAPTNTTFTSDDILGPTRDRPQVLPDMEGTFTFSLYVEDGQGNWDTDRVNVVVGPGDAPPRAVGAAAATEIVIGDALDLDGSGSYDPEGASITYQWAFTSLPQGSALRNSSITNRTSPTASFSPDVVGSYGVKLIVRDSLNADRAVISGINGIGQGDPIPD